MVTKATGKAMTKDSGGPNADTAVADHKGDWIDDLVADLPPLLRAGEVVSTLRLGRATTYALIADGTLVHVRLGDSIRVPRASVEAFLRKSVRGV